MNVAEVKIKDRKKRRKNMSNDFICGYLEAIADISSSIGNLKASFDLEAYQIRAHQKLERKIKRRSNKPSK